MRPFHDGFDRDTKLAPTIFAIIDAGTRAFALELDDPVTHHATTWADRTVRPKYGLQVLSRLIVIVENRIAKVEFFVCHVGRLSTMRQILYHVV